jgi:DNA-binding NarL/FixJ family response regulator
MEEVLSANKLLNILVIDDHESVLNATIDILQTNYPNAELNYPNAEFSTAVNAHNVLNQLNSLQHDFIVMDLSIPD